MPDSGGASQLTDKNMDQSGNQIDPDLAHPGATGLRFTLLLLGWIACYASVAAADAAEPDDDIAVLDLNRVLRPDFAGSWEKDFRLSDNWETQLTLVLDELQRQAERQARSSNAGAGGGPGPAPVRSSRRSNIVDLAQLAEYLSRQTTMRISQNDEEVRIMRQGDADLVCSISEASVETFSSPHGSERCGWDRRQLVFEISLPDDVFIMYRLSVSSDTQLLNMVIRISSRRSEPFDLVQVFKRYQAPADDFNCRQTLTRGKVCNQNFRP